MRILDERNLSVFETDMSDGAVPSTLFVTTLAQDVSRSVDLLLIADEISSQCAAASFDPLTCQLDQHSSACSSIALLSDCMKPVAGF